MNQCPSPSKAIAVPHELPLQDVMPRLEKEEESCRQVQALEPDCKWPKQSLAHILRQQAILGKASQQEMQELCQELITLDPYRAGYYRDAQTAN